MNTESQYMTKKDVMLQLQMSEATINRMLKSGELKFIKIGRLVRISREAFNKLVEKGGL